MADFLEKYSPRTDIFSNYQIDDQLLAVDRAFQSWKALLSAKRSHDGLFLVMGKLLKSFRDEKLYEQLDYENFSQFLASEEIGFSREKAYMYIKTYEYYIEYLELDPEKVGQINVSRLSMMVPMLRQIEDKTEVVKQIEEMTSLRHGDFVDSVRSKTPRGGKPEVFFSVESNHWVVRYHPNITFLIATADYEEKCS